jgi:hypothetical protein
MNGKDVLTFQATANDIEEHGQHDWRFDSPRSMYMNWQTQAEDGWWHHIRAEHLQQSICKAQIHWLNREVNV